MQRKNIALLLGFALPLLMIAVVAAILYIPGKLHKPTYNFLYTSGDNYYSNESYVVRNGKLMKISGTNYVDPERAAVAQLYIHDVTTNKSKPISYEEAQLISLDSNEESPDGYTVRDGNEGRSYFPFFGGPYTNDVFLTGHNSSRKLAVRKINNYDSVSFIGWIIK